MTLDLSIIIKALSPLRKAFANWLGKRIVGEEILERRQLLETALLPILQKAAEDVAETIEQIGNAEIDQIYLFLTSNDAETILRQIYAVSVLDSKNQYIEQIKQEFLKAFSLYTTIPKEELKDSAPKIFNILVAGCEQALTVAIDKGKLSAHEAKSVFRHQVLLDEIANINKNLEFLSIPPKLDISAINKFEQQYRQQINVRHKNITPPFIGDSKKIPIDNIYINSNFIPPLRESKDLDLDLKSTRRIDYQVLSQQIHRTVILGNPGGGKSTFAQKLTYDLANNYEQRLLASRQLTPILVILRDYGAKKKEENCSILQFIELTANAKYQLQPPVGTLEYLLLNGRVAVIFDGLDELTDTSYRQEISEDVECFCSLYPSVPVLVTSREVGYQEAPLDESKFIVYHLAPFENKQVKEYVSKWFNVGTDLTEEEQKKCVTAFLEESKAIPDLLSNPLMLGLMCNIYRGEGYIPKNRPDVYEKCAEMMFERWDKGRRISRPESIQKIESKVKPTMMYLANWIYSDEFLQQGVTETKLVNQATDYLLKRTFEDRDDAENAAKNLVKFCRGRAWVFTDMGTTKDGEKLYQFTHRTFLEYFTAAYLNRTNNTPDKLFKILLPKIAKQEWDVVSQLAFQIKNKNIEDAGDDLLSYLLEEIEKAESDEKWNLLFFATRCLEFIVPRPKTTESIVKAVFNKCIEFGLSRLDKQYQYPLNHSQLPGNTINLLHKAAEENLNNITSTIKDWSKDQLTQSNHQKLSLTIELINMLKKPILSEQLKDSIFKDYVHIIKTIAQQDLLICNFFREEHKYSLSEIIQWHGLESIFLDCDCRVSPFFLTRLSIIYCLFQDFIFSWVKVYENGYENLCKLTSENSDVLFGGYIVFAIFLEMEWSPELDDGFYGYDFLLDSWLCDKIKTTEIPFFRFIRYIFLARAEKLGKYDCEVEAELNQCKFNQQQREFIEKWIKREIDLVQQRRSHNENTPF